MRSSLQRQSDATTGMREPAHVAVFADRLLLASTSCLLFAAPLVRAGNRFAALAVLECIGLLVSVMVSWVAIRRLADASRAFPLRAGSALLAAACVVAIMSHLFPLPALWWQGLPGRAVYAQALEAVQASPPQHRLSLTPASTLLSLFAAIPVLAAFVAAQVLGSGHLVRALKLIACIALVQAMTGLLQVGGAHWLYFDASFAANAIGTFGNANHMANLLAMALPIAVFCAMGNLAPIRSSGDSRRKSIQRLLGIGWVAIAFVLLAGVMATKSRAGIVIASAVTVGAVGAVGAGGGTGIALRARALLGVVLVFLAVAAVGMQPLLTRFGPTRGGIDLAMRWDLVQSSWQAALTYWPAGAGWGSFWAVFPRFQSAAVPEFVQHAHNDYVQGLVEGGAIFLVLVAMTATLSVRRLLELMRSQDGGSAQARWSRACGLGVGALALHSVVDFNTHIPANAIIGAFLFGAYLRKGGHPTQTPLR